MSQAELTWALEQMRWAGFPESEVAKAEADAKATWRLGSGNFLVLRHNAKAIQLLVALATQWRTTSLNTASKAIVIRTGLDYSVAEDVARFEGLAPIEVDDFRRLRMAEAEALAAFAQARERSQ